MVLPAPRDAFVPSLLHIWFVRVAGVGVIGAGSYYLWWRLSTLHGIHPYGIALFVAEAVSFGFLCFTVALLVRVKRRTDPVPPPIGTLDVFIPVAGEPIEIVEKTLRRALAIRYPHRTYLLNDGWMARASNWRDVEHLAARYGVQCFTRRSGERGKAGNLNHARRRTHGNVIAVVDADHQAESTLGHVTLGYFRDPKVGFVATPQRFKMEGKDVLGSRERAFYRYIQPAKDAVGAAFSCGNGALYRREALVSIGGFSEWNVVEDLHTSYRLHSAGWKSVYHPAPITTGITPEVASVFAKQRLGWATDSLRMLLWDNPLKAKGLTLGQKLHYFWTTMFYLVMTLQIVFVLGPVMHLFFGISIMSPPSMESYLLHAAPYFALLLAFTGGLGGLGDGIAAILKGLYLWPIYTLALIRAVISARIEPPITIKTRTSGISPLLIPQYLLLGLLIAAIVKGLTRPDEGTAVSSAWAAFMALAFATFVLSLGFGGALMRGVRALTRMGLAGLCIALFAATFMVSVTEVPLPSAARRIVAPETDLAPGAAALPLQTILPPESGAYFGIFSPEMFRRDEPVRSWTAMTGVRPRLVHWYQEWGGPEPGFQRGWAEFADQQGTVPMISWEPWEKPGDGVHDPAQTAYRLERIAEGDYDAYITKWARAAARYRRPILLRFMHEMNGYWYPWSIRENGNTPNDFVAAWRRTHDIFEREGAANVSWVWSVVGFQGLEGGKALGRFYPGDDYVDWVGTSAFNWGSSEVWTRWSDIDVVFGDTYRALTRFDKPVMISELGTVQSGGDIARWMQDLDNALVTRYPKVRAVVWFDDMYPGGIDFRVRGAAADAMRGTFGLRDYWGAGLNRRRAEEGSPSWLAGPQLAR